MPRDLPELFAAAGRTVPSALGDWEERAPAWRAAYRRLEPQAEMVEITLDHAIYLFDLTGERVVLAYGLSARPARERDTSRMRGFPDVNPSMRAVMDDAAPADRGHFVAHTAGGPLDLNLFPQRRNLNRGWSAEGKRYRAMEKYLAARPETFFYHLPIYCDDTWVPAELELGVLREGKTWWVGRFGNR